MKYLNRKKYKYSKISKKVLRNRISLQETQLSNTSLKNDEIENSENFGNIVKEEEEESEPDSPLMSETNSVNSFPETNDLVTIAKNFTSYKKFNRTKQLQIQYSFRKMLFSFEEELLYSKFSITA